MPPRRRNAAGKRIIWTDQMISDLISCRERALEERNSPTSFPGFLLLSSGRDPGCGWSRGSQILGAKFNCNCERGGKGVCL